MTSSLYRVLVSQANDPSNFTAELPFTSIEMLEELNGPGSCVVGLPLRPFGPDEEVEVRAQKAIVAQGSTNPAYVAYPTDGTYLNGATTGLLMGTVKLEVPSYGGINWEIMTTFLGGWDLGLDDGYPRITVRGPGGADEDLTSTKRLSSVGVSPGDVIELRYSYNTYTTQAVFSYRTDDFGSWATIDSVSGTHSELDRSINAYFMPAPIFPTPGVDLKVLRVHVTMNGSDTIVSLEPNNTDLSQSPCEVGNGYRWETERDELLIEDYLPAYTYTKEPPNTVTVPNLAPGSHCLWVERAGKLFWAGLIWTVSGSIDGNNLEVGAAGFHSYTRKRAMRHDLTYSAQDQLEIAREIIEHMETRTGSLGLIITDPAEPLSGVNRDRTYLADESRPYGTVLEQLSAVNDGFDFFYEPEYDVTGTPQVVFRTEYPSTGRPTDLVFEIGSNVETVAFTDNGTAINNRVIALGATGVKSTVTDSARRSTYPLLETVISKPDVSVMATLTEHAQRHIGRGVPVRQLTMRVTADSHTPIGGYRVGDIVEVRGSYGYLELTGNHRITQINHSVAQGAGEYSTVSTASAEAFTTWS